LLKGDEDECKTRSADKVEGAEADGPEGQKEVASVYLDLQPVVMPVELQIKHNNKKTTLTISDCRTS
jgi:hypothetical protein